MVQTKQPYRSKQKKLRLLRLGLHKKVYATSSTVNKANLQLTCDRKKIILNKPKSFKWNLNTSTSIILFKP